MAIPNLKAPHKLYLSGASQVSEGQVLGRATCPSIMSEAQRLPKRIPPGTPPPAQEPAPSGARVNDLSAILLPLEFAGGEGGIRTPDTRQGMAAFEAARFNGSRRVPHPFARFWRRVGEVSSTADPSTPLGMTALEGLEVPAFMRGKKIRAL